MHTPLLLSLSFSEQADAVKQAMAGFTLPLSSVPSWANEVPESVWKQELLQGLRNHAKPHTPTTWLIVSLPMYMYVRPSLQNYGFLGPTTKQNSDSMKWFFMQQTQLIYWTNKRDEYTIFALTSVTRESKVRIMISPPPLGRMKKKKLIGIW